MRRDSLGQWQTYATPTCVFNEPTWHEDHSARMVEAHQRRIVNAGRIPIDEWRSAIRRLKESSGLSWREMAEKGGISSGQMHGLVHDRRLRSVDREWTRNFIRRLAGLGAPPTTRQKREAERVRNLRI